MLEIFLQFVFSIIGATAGATFGAIFAIRRIRNETAFARRLLWCEEAMKSFNAAGAAIVSAQQTNSETCWTEAIQCYEKLIPLCGQKEIYATERAVKAINDFMNAFYNLIEAHLTTHDSKKPSNDGDLCLKKLKNASVTLAKEARSHLGISSLPEEFIDSDSKFAGSFRGRNLYGHEKQSTVEKLFVVSHTNDGENVRIINAREPTRGEREKYEQEQK